MRSFLQNHKNQEMEIFAFCVITFEPIGFQTHSAPQNDRLNLSFVKDIYLVGEKKTPFYNIYLSIFQVMSIDIHL